MLVVVALGGNALLRRGERMDPEIQRGNVAMAAGAMAEIARRHHLVVTHGNGPQIGLLAAAQPVNAGTPFPLDVLGAESQGMIGYVIESELSARLPGREVATLLTQVVVDPNDRAFASPTKPIGPIYSDAEARNLKSQFGWSIVSDGAGFRRAVPSPMPQHIREMNAIRVLVEAGVVAICAGGGGVPVVIDHRSGAIMGVEAVVDKDRSAALLASELSADALLILTDVPAVFTDWGGPASRAVRRATPSGISHYAFEPGSMGPKVEAACAFVSKTGGMAVIGALADAPSMLRGEAGTLIDAGGPEIEWYETDRSPGGGVATRNG